MKMPAIIPAILCVVAGILLAGKEVVTGNMEVMGISFGLYFIGKGFFIHGLLSATYDIRDKR